MDIILLNRQTMSRKHSKEMREYWRINKQRQRESHKKLAQKKGNKKK